jgi:uncharacterized protein YyaL (SSP411 family)
LIDSVHDQFWDADNLGYFYSSNLNTDVLKRLKTGSDTPLPNPNSVMVENLLQYHYYTGDKDYLEKAEYVLRLFSEQAYNHPTGFGAMLQSMQWYFYGSIDIVITNPKLTLDEIEKDLNNFFIPRMHLWVGEGIFPELKAFSDKFSFNSKYDYYFCKNFQCLPPTMDWVVFTQQLNQNLHKINEEKSV